MVIEECFRKIRVMRSLAGFKNEEMKPKAVFFPAFSFSLNARIQKGTEIFVVSLMRTRHTKIDENRDRLIVSYLTIRYSCSGHRAANIWQTAICFRMNLCVVELSIQVE